MNDGAFPYLDSRECLLAIRSRIDELTSGIDPAPWYVASPAALPGDNETPNVRQMAVYARANATFFRAMLTGSLRGWFVDGSERWEIPGWAWADQGGDWRALLMGNDFLHPLAPPDVRRWAWLPVLVEQLTFAAWLASDEISDQSGFPKLPPAHDEVSRRPLITSKALPDRPTVTLCEAVSWLAFGIALDSVTLSAALNGDAFGPDFNAVQRKLQSAVDRLTMAGTGGLPLYGKMLRAGDDPARILTDAIPPAHLHDFRQFDVEFDGLRHGDGLTWERTAPNAIARARSASSVQVRDVKVSRVELLQCFPTVQESAERVLSTARAGINCEAWIKEQFAADPEKLRAKASFQADALKEFSGRLSKRGFSRVWANVAPAAGRSTAGAKSKR